MQILIDSAVETPASLRHAALLVNYWAALTEGRETSINGDAGEITLTTTETHTIGDISHTIIHEASKRPAAPLPPGDRPIAPVVHPERHHDAPEPAKDPAAVFGVPAGTIVDPTPAASSASGAIPTPAQTGAASVISNVPAVAPGADTAPASPGTATGATASDLDKAGIPWDARIHSDTRKQNADGTWRFRRNLETVTRDAVMMELRAAAVQQVSLPPGPSADAVSGQLPLSPEAPPVPQQPIAAHTVPTAPDAPVSLPAVSLPSASTVRVPDPPDAGVVSVPVTGFRALMSKINIARAKGLLTQDQVDAACRDGGADGITALAAQPALVPKVDYQLNRYLGVVG